MSMGIGRRKLLTFVFEHNIWRGCKDLGILYRIDY